MPKDVATLVLALTSLLVVVVTSFCLTWRKMKWDRKWRNSDKLAAINADYKEVRPSMAWLGMLWWQHKQQGLFPWAAAYRGELYPPSPSDSTSPTDDRPQQQGSPSGVTMSPKEQSEALRELNQHLGVVDSFWDKVVGMLEAEELTLFDTTSNHGVGWIWRANNYRLLSEPLYIVDHYRCGFDRKQGPYLENNNRPHRYIYLEKAWHSLYAGQPLVPSTAWAAKFEELLAEAMEKETAMVVEGKSEESKSEGSSATPGAIHNEPDRLSDEGVFGVVCQTCHPHALLMHS